MNILQINKFHYFRGGVETVYLNTARLLESHGHHPVFFSMHHPQNLPCEYSKYFMPFVELDAHVKLIDKIKIGGRALYSFEARKLLSNLLDAYPVDIAHLHSICYHISPSILHELKKRKIPVVMTLHDNKMVCSSYYLQADGKACEGCHGGNYYMAIKNRCVKNSYSKSMLAALEMYLHHRILDIYDKVDVFIASSLFLKNKLIEMGFKKEIVYLQNFIDTQKVKKFNEEVKDEKGPKKNYVIYVGRLAPEKGVFTLLDAAKLLSHEKRNIEIKLSGNGLIREMLQEKVNSEHINNIRFLGYIKYEDLCQEIEDSMAMVLPSECYESNPIAVLEAFALGKPVIGTRFGHLPELIRDTERGLIFEPGRPDDLSSKIGYMMDNPDKVAEMGKNARIFAEQELSAEKHYQELVEIYNEAIQKNLLRSK
jgi:glycosyltransferase involved in cell wall biosynthesis